jgi:CheY-like chemotaxis protein
MTENDDQTDHVRRRPRVLIADDHPAMRAALARLVRTECDVVGTVADGDILAAEARRLEPDVVVSDLFMPTLDGFAAGRQIKIESPATRLIYVTGHSDSAFVAEALQIGAFALVPKISAGRELLQVIREAMAHEPGRAPEVDGVGPDTSVGARLPPTADPYQVLIREFSALHPDGDDSVFADLPTLRTHLNRSPFPAMATDDDGRYVMVNEATAALTGFEVHELESMSVGDLTPPLQSGLCERLWSEFLAIGEQWGTYCLVGKHGIPIDVYYYSRAQVFSSVHLSVLLPRR